MFGLVPPTEPELCVLNRWRGVGDVVTGMYRQGFDLQLTQCDERGWRATFYTTGMEHSPTSATGTGWEATPWQTTQWAAWIVTDPHGQRLVRVAALVRVAPFG